MALLLPKNFSQQMLVDTGVALLWTDGFAMCITIRMCASRHASRRPSTRSHQPMNRARSERRVVSFSGGLCLSQANGYVVWAKLWCLSRQWQRKTTRATSLGDARSAGKTASEVPRMIFAKFDCDAMWITSTTTAVSQTRRSPHRLSQWCNRTSSMSRLGGRREPICQEFYDGWPSMPAQRQQRALCSSAVLP